MQDDSKDERLNAPGVWIFVRGSEAQIPQTWRDRAVPIWLLPLTPQESQELLRERTLTPDLSAGDAEIATLLARGLSPAAIATRTGRSLRTVHRRLAALRELLQTSSTAELAVLLASRGF